MHQHEDQSRPPGQPPSTERCEPKRGLGGLARLEGGVFRLLDGLAVAAFVIMVTIVFLTVILREALGLPYPWLDDIVRYLMIWVVYLGVAVLCRTNDHISVDVFYSRMPRPVRRCVDALVGLTGLIVSAYTAWLGWTFTARAFAQGQLSSSGYIYSWMGYLAIPVGFGLAALGYALYLSSLVRSRGSGAS